MTDRRLEKLPRVERWPTADEAAAARWFQPVRLGPVTAADRTWVPAMVPWRASDGGEVTDAVIEWYRRFAEGRPGVIVVEATGIRDVPSGPLLRIGHDRFLPGLSRLVNAVAEASDGRTRLFIQLIDFLAIKRRPTREAFLGRFVRVDADMLARLGVATEAEARARLLALPEGEAEALLPPRELESLRMGFRERITDVDRPHIRDLPRVLPGLFADAARRAAGAGFHGVELHYAHAYTMASFLSARNTRGDGYGGPRENRVRLPLEVLRAVRAAVPPELAVGCRFLGDEVIEGGNRVEDAAWFGVELARAGIDFLSVSKGGKFEDAKQPKVGEAAYPYTGPSGHECMPTVHIGGAGPFSRNLPLAAAVRRAVRAAGLETPVVAAGGISTFEQAEGALARGEADVIAAARQTLADPDWFLKLRLGRGAEIRRCFFTNYCEALDQHHREVTCQRWDRQFTPGESPRLAVDGRRRLTAPPWRPGDPA